jgi:phosphohistidine phosphatase
MELLLWRHAEAEDGHPDLERRLTPRGEKQARRMAQWLDARLPGSARLMVSPAVRTMQTAQALVEISDRRIKVVPALAPGAGVDEFLEAVGWPSARSPVIAVGHQPTLGAVASALLAGDMQDWSFKKGAVWWFTHERGIEPASASLLVSLHPGLV